MKKSLFFELDTPLDILSKTRWPFFFALPASCKVKAASELLVFVALLFSRENNSSFGSCSSQLGERRQFLFLFFFILHQRKRTLSNNGEGEPNSILTIVFLSTFVNNVDCICQSEGSNRFNRFVRTSPRQDRSSDSSSFLTSVNRYFFSFLILLLTDLKWMLKLEKEKQETFRRLFFIKT